MTVFPASVLIAIAALSLSLPLLAWSLFGRRDPEQRQRLLNLQRGLTEPDEDSAHPRSLIGALRPAMVRLSQRITPRGSLARLDRLLSRAGRPAAWPLERVLVVKLVLPIIAGGLGLLYLNTAFSRNAAIGAVVLTVVVCFLPELLLKSQGDKRAQAITLELADTKDQMTIAVEAGLGFDSAMARAGRNGKGALAEELVRTMQDMQLGQSRREAYESLALRTGVPDLRKFVRAIIQADIYGIAISDVLRTQAAEMRMKRRQRAEEKAMQIPVKVIFPLMLCILPVLFIVLLGPAVMDIMKAFS